MTENIKDLALQISRIIDQKALLDAFETHPILRKQLNINQRKLEERLSVALTNPNNKESDDK